MLRDRLIELIDMEGLNPNQFYLKTGLGNGFLNNVGETLRRPSLDKIKKAFPHWNLEYVLKGEGGKTISIDRNKGIVNMGDIGGHQVSISGNGYEKIIGADKIELISSEANKICLQEVASLKAEILRLEALIKSKDETIAAKDDTIGILKNR